MTRASQVPLSKNLITRLWQKDVSLWCHAESTAIENRLGWLDAVVWMETHIDELTRWAQTASNQFDNVILLGMGGSSLAAEVFSAVFGNQHDSIQACPRLWVVDTTSPAQINALDVDLARSLIIVASKSGSTVETAALLMYFHAQLRQHVARPGDHLVAITDPDSWLHRHAVENGFMRVFLNPPDIGGRYSALSYFGLVPAALIGVDLQQLLARTRRLSDACQSDDNQSDDNPTAHAVSQLANLIGNAALSASNILQLRLAPPLQSLAVWIEQLVAESLGKEAKGILPVYDDLGDDSEYIPNQSDIFSVYIGLGEDDQGGARTSTRATDMQWHLASRYDLGAEFLRWEMATALAASIMGVNPFDQPDVEQAKQQTRLLITARQAQPFGKLFENQHYAVYSNTLGESSHTIQSVFDRFGTLSTTALYLAVLAYLPNFVDVNDRLQVLRRRLAQHFVLTTTLGYGPRYLHSTGQLHKGGPASGCFIQITEQAMEEIAIPERDYSFADLHSAQADGDYAVLEKKGRPLMRITLKGDRCMALDKLLADIERLDGMQLKIENDN